MQILPRRRLATGRLPSVGRGEAAQQAKRERVHLARPSPLHVATQWVKKQVRKLNSGHRLPPHPTPTTVDADETPTLPNNRSDCHQLSVGPPNPLSLFPGLTCGAQTTLVLGLKSVSGLEEHTDRKTRAFFKINSEQRAADARVAGHTPTSRRVLESATYV